MKINLKAVAKAIVVLLLLTILPIVGRQWIPEEFFRAFSAQGGFDINGLINSVALIGVVLSVLILLRGHAEQTSSTYLVLSAVWKVFWLGIVFFVLGAGHPETLGLLMLGGKSGANENIVVFDFRLFAFLATVIVIVMIVRSVLQFQENTSKAKSQEAPARVTGNGK